ncbi:ABC transporter substrate-binding protein [Pseudarthrobacter sp. CC12]|uniref:ABC transporter substrate-binding protein n=1 Tax=Pseudarthrobacter sp. CC12 TaxID=3029193 RepID=UPI0032641666
MRTRILASATTIALSGAMLFGVAAPSSAAAPTAPAASTQASQLVGTATINQTIAGVGTFAGTFTPTGFSTQNGQLAVTGLLSGTFTSVAGDITPISQTLTTTVLSATTTPTGTCDILNLVLGPLHLNVLGLVVDLNQVVLHITAQSGAGNLLGNLLCSVAGLLDGGTGLNGLAALLNRLLGL